ncbi:hypothetical protein ACIQOU_29135 [Streptomyces sp. NPDC091279]|uniref:hypothetical protein n=1 Tax=Streptomyces sp. NPDC091279 TaxID=3365983 RepID=UPI003803AAC5
MSVVATPVAEPTPTPTPSLTAGLALVDRLVNAAGASPEPLATGGEVTPVHAESSATEAEVAPVHAESLVAEAEVMPVHAESLVAEAGVTPERGAGNGATSPDGGSAEVPPVHAEFRVAEAEVTPVHAESRVAEAEVTPERGAGNGATSPDGGSAEVPPVHAESLVAEAEVMPGRGAGNGATSPDGAAAEVPPVHAEPPVAEAEVAPVHAGFPLGEGEVTSGSAAAGEQPAVPGEFAELVAQIGRAVDAEAFERAAALVFRLREHTVRAFGPEHPHTLEALSLEAYVAHRGDNHRLATLTCLELAHLRFRHADPRTRDELTRAVAAWRRVDEMPFALEHGRALLALWTELTQQQRPTPQDTELMRRVNRRIHALAAAPDGHQTGVA